MQSVRHTHVFIFSIRCRPSVKSDSRPVQDHPGGAKAVLTFAGRDASREFVKLHKPEILTKVGAARLACELLGL